MYEKISKLEEEMKLELKLFGSGCCQNYANPERMKLISKSNGKK
ncbi:MAG: hypothetical protein ABDH59_03360 [Fervidobacterium sp.]